MNKRKIFKIMTSAFLISMLVSGCTNVKKLSSSEKTKVMNKIYNYSSTEKEGLDGLDNLIKSNIDQFNIKERDEMVNIYISNMFNFMDNLNNKLYCLGFELEDVVEQYKINVNDEASFNSIPKEHATIKGFLQEVKSKGFSLEAGNKNSNYTITVNLEKVNEKYGKYISESLKRYLEFNNYEINSNIQVIDDNKKTVNLDEVIKRIKKIEAGMDIDKKQSYEFADKWISSLEYYYNILFGISHNYFIETEYFNSNILKQYKDIIESNKNTDMSKKLSKVVNVLEKNNRKFDSNTKVQIENIINEIYTKDIKDAINKKYPEQISND